MPAAHGVQVLAPSAEEYVPAGQVGQAVFRPVVFDAVPFAQDMHELTPNASEAVL